MTKRLFGSKEGYERARVMKSGERCGNCYFSRPTPDLRIVFCKRQLRAYPMPAGPGKMGQLIMWPELPKEEWCGDWKAKGPSIVIDGEIENQVQN